MFFILPVGVDYRARRYPVVTFTLMGLCVLVYLIMLVLQFAGGGEDAEARIQWVVENMCVVPAESHWWTYLTYQFVHAGFFHVAGNMVYLFLFGACVEDMLGRVRFTAFYLVCGIVAALAHIAVSPDHFASETPLAGASGSISGCIGGFLLLLAKTKIEFKWLFWFWFRIWTGEFHLPAWLVISFWFLQDFALMILTAGERGGGVAFAAHVGGTLLGVAWMSLEKLRMKRHPEIEDEEEESPVMVPRRPMAANRPRRAAAPAAVEAPTIYLFVNESQAGPFTLSQIQQMFANDALAADALYWQQGMEGWRSAEELRLPGMG
jgi:membrane associated rhomboid family serine protease